MSKYTIPNLLTILRLILSPVFFILLVTEKIYLGLIVFMIVALTDIIDGYIARKYNQKSDFGKFVDPMADKFMVLLALIALLWKYDFPIWGLLILSRDIISLAGSLLIYFKKSSSWDASRFGKWTTFVQVITIITYISGFVYKQEILIFAILLSSLTAVQYFIRGVKLVMNK